MSRATGTLLMLVAAVAGTFAGAWWARSQVTKDEPPPQVADFVSLRVHQLVVVDDAGKSHIVLGATNDGGMVTLKSGGATDSMVVLNVDHSTARVAASNSQRTKTLEVLAP